MAKLVERLRQAPALPATLPDQQGRIVRGALDGQSVYEIAQAEGIAEEAVWETLGTAAQSAINQMPEDRVEMGGMGSDTDPGVTGGYGDTALGSLEGEEPTPE
ncbi:MAG: hypothetical protein M3220_10045 [Chloroflexota bacterium]|nr:hypothetical protein [Chloroflexota bacterium]